MTPAELDFIKDAFSQIIDDIAGNPDWHDAASAVSADLGALERELEGKVVSPDKSLEEEYKDYVERDPVFSKLVNRNAGLTVAHHVAEWQKSQMLKDAFVANYVVHDGRIALEGDPLPSLDPILLLPYPQFKPNDKVKLIIVKED